MKKISTIMLFAGILLAMVSCDGFLGDNENVNQATDITPPTPQLLLPNALTSTANTMRIANEEGSFIAGFIVNAGGFGGWGSDVSYNFTVNDHAVLWASLYDDLNNYQAVLKASEGVPALDYYNAIARIMKAYDFQLLVDFYGDVPYSEALQGLGNLNPKYDAAEDIYRDLVVQLDMAIELMEDADPDVVSTITASSDVMFGGDIDRWIEFANTLKLKILIRSSGSPEMASFVTTAFAGMTSATFLQDDATVNPGYLGNAGQQNPMWNAYHTTADGTQPNAGRSRIPSTFVMSLYNGTRITDDGRGAAIYRGFPGTPHGQLGNLDDNPFAPTGNIAWYTGSDGETGIGIFKGRTASYPLFLAAEARFLEAEAYLKGYLAGDAEATYIRGIEASFNYLYKGSNGSVAAGLNPYADAATYLADNAGNPLVEYSAATTLAERLEAIITQKYIALNFIHGHEAWNEFRRTGYPTVATGASATNPVLSFASIASQSPRADRLPIRVLYAASEYQLNSANVPNNINQFTDLIFWQAQ